MHKAVLKKIGICLSGFILITWMAFLPAPLWGAEPTELTDSEMADVYAHGFSTFTRDDVTGIMRADFHGMDLRTWTEVSSLKMGHYNNGTTTGWDNDWTNVSLGSSGADLFAKGLYVEMKFTNPNDPATRQLEYLRIGTNDLTGTISAHFNSFSGTVDNGVTNMSRANLGAASISTTNGGFYLSLERNPTTGGYKFNWTNATITP